MASQEDPKIVAEHRKAIIQAANVVSHLPLPMFVFNKEQIVVNASNAGLEYCNVSSAQLFGKPLYENINLEFTTENTLESWVADCQKNKVTDLAYWQRVHVRQPNAQLRQCDISAYYNRDNQSGTEFIVTLFDRTEQYNQDDDNISYVALAVHELRTPLTMLRGYIEVFQEELSGNLDAELTSFMHKMVVSAQQLAAFLNNILNVARIEQNQLTLNLTETPWGEVLKAACDELNLKAQVHARKISVNITPDLPTVAIDRMSIIEVINNLLDNAIKYSKYGETIMVDTHLRNDGYVETTVQDHGVGIPTGVVTNLFDKFYRNHRTSGNVGGTGLGLYLSKAIINAHGGEIWVQSKEGEGSTFGFTLVPANKLAAELKSSDNNTIVRNAHGWIKNHSLYRR
jgi:signal transduction histidine kinase